ncbi:9116_t:CDS:2, partial [Racocetra persica]
MSLSDELFQECLNEDELFQECLNEERIEFYEYSNFKDVKLIKEGGYGIVYSATLKSKEITIALKSFKSNVAIEEVVKELKLHRLTVAIMNGTRESNIEGTPSEYNKIYTDCWQQDPDSRPDIQQVFLNLRDLNCRRTINRIAPNLNVPNVHELTQIDPSNLLSMVIPLSPILNHDD